jgi:hypothetical protein
MSAAGISAMAAGIAIPISLRLLSKLFPSALPPPVAMPFDALKAKYRPWLSTMAVVMIVVTVPLCPGFYFVFSRLASWCAGLLPAADITFAPIVWSYWLVPAFLLALTCSGFAAMAYVRWRLGERYGEFLTFWSQSSRMNPIRANKAVLGSCACLCACLVFLGLRPYVQLRGDELAVQGYFSAIETRYPLSEINRITTSAHFIARDGHTVARREYVVSFAGNRRWTTAYIPSDPDPDAKRLFIETLSRWSHVPIEEVNVFPRGEL